MSPHPHKVDTITTSHFTDEETEAEGSSGVYPVSHSWWGSEPGFKPHAFSITGKNKRRPVPPRRVILFPLGRSGPKLPHSFFTSLSPRSLHLDEDPGGRNGHNQACTSEPESRVTSTRPAAELRSRSASVLPCSVLTVSPGVV